MQRQKPGHTVSLSLSKKKNPMFPVLLPMKPHWDTARYARIGVWMTLWVMFTSPSIKDRKGLKSQR